MVKKTTNEELARMIKVGFDDVTNRITTKEDLKLLATKEDLGLVKEDIGSLRNDFQKLELKMDVGFSNIEDELIPKLDFEDLEGRVGYIEKKLDIVSGK